MQPDFVSYFQNKENHQTDDQEIDVVKKLAANPLWLRIAVTKNALEPPSFVPDASDTHILPYFEKAIRREDQD